MASQMGSTVPRRQLGRQLRDLRRAAGLSVKAAAGELERAESTIFRMEAGHVPSRSIDVRAMCELYGASAETTAGLVGLAKETKSKGWWHAYGDSIPENFDVYVGLESSASSLDWFETDIVPGLLQTEEYASEVMRLNAVDISDDERAGRVGLRVARQAVLRRSANPLLLRAVISETVLRRVIGDPGVMARQLSHLVFVSEWANVRVRVVPFDAGAHPGVVTGPFEVIRFPSDAAGADTEPPTVFADGYTGGLYLEKPREVETFDRAFRVVWDAALDEDASRRMLADTAGSYEQHA